MQFLTSGDFGFPFSWVFFFIKQFFLWSYQTGAANLDGVIRAPGRIVHLLVFMGFGNVAFDYFYLLSTLLVAFLAFMYFATKVLHVQTKAACMLGALFFALNPIFLGNLAKVGLILAAAMLPLCLALVHQGFYKKRWSYFVLWTIVLNISLIHPFTFTVNVVVSGCYFLYLANQNRHFAFKNIAKFMAIGVLAVIMNLYFLLPIASMRTLNKSVLSDTITSEPIDYTALVDVLNTGDVLTGLSLSRNVLLDFEFYDGAYIKFYFFGVFLFYVLLFGMFTRLEKQALQKDKQRFVIILVAFAVLVLLAAVTVFSIGDLIKMLVQMPGGWTFRSPLKWQLYIPLALAAMLAILLEYVTEKRWRIITYSGLLLSFVLMNGFISTDIYNKLLTPRSIVYFNQLQQKNFTHDSMLFVNGDRCVELQQQNPRVMSEFNQIMSSKDVQLKRVGATDIGLVDLAGYDYIMDCHGVLATGLADTYDFLPDASFAKGNFELYKNSNTKPYVYTTDSVVRLGQADELDDYYTFTTQTLGRDFDMMGAQGARLPVTTAQNVFEALGPESIGQYGLQVGIRPIDSGSLQMYMLPGNELYYAQQDNKVLLSAQPQDSFTELPADTEGILRLNGIGRNDVQVAYIDTNYDYSNRISNPSFEDGLWQKKVGDCYNYDDSPAVFMDLNKSSKSDGRQSLQLRSARHIACTGPKDIGVKPGQTYVLGFDYQSPDRAGGYSVVFNDEAKTTHQERLASQGDDWSHFSKLVTVPEGATSLKFLFRAHPTGSGVARFDNVKLVAIPDIARRFYMVNTSGKELQNPQRVEYAVRNPAKTDIVITGARKPFYLATGESYSDSWRLAVSSARSSWSPFWSPVTIPTNSHFVLNGQNNGWYIDPQGVCDQLGRQCQQNPDGTYTLHLTMEFMPQRWFYFGGLISGLAFITALAYVTRDWLRHRSKKGLYRWRSDGRR